MKELSISETQKISLEILHIVADICETQNYRYCLMYGTLIGAVRHKGYIPWDDDVDIMMPREDYEKFLKYFKNNIQKYPHLKIFNPDECKAYPYMITRISDERYQIDMANEKPYGMGVFIDIYPFDGMGMSYEEAVSYGRKGDRLSSFCYQATRRHLAIETTTSFVRKVIKPFVFVVCRIIGKNFFQNNLKKLVGRYDYDKSKYVGCVVWASHVEKDIYQKAWFDETKLAPFEQYEFRIPVKYDKILKQTYGDYMKLPPEKDRIGHHYYKVYKKYDARIN